MVFRTLWTRLSSLWRSDTTDEEPPTDEPDAIEESETDATLSYAEQVEYGVDDRDLSDEDKILRLLVKRGGRVDETTIIEQTGWSEDHLERVVDTMEADDQISAVTVGRKRVICRRGFEPKGYRSHLGE
ncbi:helix-turn-helix transcriptional regulator [Natrialbaceae archaeon AArc-T1-2]|uniref:helix-turn-helix transcriptional regulator n=1 Tax=Natrialbaceae archaeon AArc-T1-2 TaxID=3053904 RepID=UPI00255AFCAA|nr:hypothetical protein [Natrialbaceae archaeon AArc-T1-2]WIV66427.1 hypothetical protein QQ977_12100 [Natrialbaceae archaeon AArc-T1-2]